MVIKNSIVNMLMLSSISNHSISCYENTEISSSCNEICQSIVPPQEQLAGSKALDNFPRIEGSASTTVFSRRLTYHLGSGFSKAGVETAL